MPGRPVYYATDAVEDYCAELHTFGLAPATVSGYECYLRKFRRACEEIATERGKRSPLTTEEIDTKVVARYFAASTGTQGNLNNMLHPLRMFLRWLIAGGHIDQGAVQRLLANRKYRKPTRQPKHYIPAEDFDEMLDAPGLVHPSQRAAVALFLYTLARRNEIAGSDEVPGIRFRDIDLTGQTINIYRQKRKRWTAVGISPELMEELAMWLLEYRSAAGFAGSTEEFLKAHPAWKLIPRLKRAYVRGANGRLTREQYIKLDPDNSPTHLERLIKLGLDHLGVETTRTGARVRHLGEGCHTIRRSGARAMLDHLSKDLGHERALLQVATMLDHDDPRQTLLYIGMDEEREELNQWLRGNSMYGGAAKRRPGNVVPIRRTA